MSAKNTVTGTAKQIIAEIVGDGRLAEEGARQARESSPRLAGPLEPGRPKAAPSKPRAERASERWEDVIEGADKADAEDRDLVHGDGGTLGLGDGEDLNKSD